MAQETVLINFEVDYTELTNAQEQLAKAGKIDNKGFQDIQKAINTTATDTKGLITQFKNVAGASIKMGKTVEAAFGAGIQDALDEAGVSVEEFGAALKKANAPAITLKKELQQLKEAMARMKAEGKDTGKEFDALRSRAGKLSDAISDANAEIKNAGSDTRGIDNVVGSISALAGGYAAVQGAAALFGEENEDLQKSLLKVNGAMALASGLQQTMNALQKEGALTKLADSIQTKASAAAQYIYAAAVGTSTGAMKAFRIALLATGIGAIIVLIGLAADAMGLFGSKTDEAADKAQDLADGLKNLNTELENNIDALKRSAALQLEYLKQRGASEKDLFEKSQSYTKAESQAILKNALDRIRLLGVEDLVRTKQDADNLLSIKTRIAASEFISKKQKAFLDEQIKGLQEVSDAFKRISDLDADVTLKTEQFKTKVAEDGFKKRKEFLDKQAAALKKALEEAERQEGETAKNTIKINLDRVLKEIDQEFIGFENKADIDAQLYEEKKKNATDWDTQWKAFQASLVKSSEDAAAKIKADAEAEDELLKKRIQNYIAVGQQVANFYSLLASLASDQERQRIDEQKRQLDGLEKAGAITEKQAKIRRQQIEQAERQAKQKQAEREKTAATFRALLAIPTAFLQGLAQGGIYLAAVYAALAAAEAALIISRPVPKFFKGKKDRYSGPGVVADMGSELVERNGRMYLYTKPTQTYLGANDKVYTAAETRNIMHNTNISTTIKQPKQELFDYDKLGKSIPKDLININIDKDFISEAVSNGLSKNNYFNNRYQFKR